MLKYSKIVKTVAIILVISGVFMLMYRGVKLREPDKVTNIGPIELKEEQHVPINWSPYTGVIFIALGGSLLIFSRKKIPPPDSE